MIDALLVGNVFVVIADFSLGGRGVDRLRQLVGLLQAFRQLYAAYGAVLLVACPAGTGDVAADDALDRQHVQLLAQHAVAVKLRLLEVFRHVLDVYRNHVVRDNVLGQIEPELGHLSQNGALLLDGVLEDDIKAADAVGCYHNQAVSVVVNLTNLAFLNRLHFLCTHVIYLTICERLSITILDNQISREKSIVKLTIILKMSKKCEIWHMKARFGIGGRRKM